MIKIFFIICLASVLLFITQTSFADYIEPQFRNLSTPCNGQECYFGTQRPTAVIFDVQAVDGLGQKLNVECDQYSGHIFPTGKTKVHCMARDEFGHEIRGHFIVTVGYNIVQIPSWFKATVGYWVDGKTTDYDYFNAISYMLEHDIIELPTAGNLRNSTELEIPSWIILYSDDWRNNKTGDQEFSIVLQWLIENEFVIR